MAKKVEYSVEERLRALYDLQLIDSRIDKLRSVANRMATTVNIDTKHKRLFIIIAFSGTENV